MNLTHHGARRLLLALALPVLVATHPALAATLIIGTGPMVEGSGNMVDEVRNAAGYTRIELNGPIDVQLKRAGTEKVVVHADDNIASLIETRVEGGKLFVEVKKEASFRTRSKLLVLVDFKQLDALQLRGSGDVLADDIKAAIFEVVLQGSGNLKIGRLEADTVAVSLAGSGNFDARGRAEKIGFVIQGSGDVNAEDLQAKSAAVRISGSGDARVHATESLQARIAGSGDVRYRGSPQVEKKVAGSGDVKPLR